jgi:hypothetical protein
MTKSRASLDPSNTPTLLQHVHKRVRRMPRSRVKQLVLTSASGPQRFQRRVSTLSLGSHGVLSSSALSSSSFRRVLVSYLVCPYRGPFPRLRFIQSPRDLLKTPASLRGVPKPLPEIHTDHLRPVFRHHNTVSHDTPPEVVPTLCHNQLRRRFAAPLSCIS